MDTGFGNPDYPHFSIIPPLLSTGGEQGRRFTRAGAISLELLYPRLVLSEGHSLGFSGGRFAHLNAASLYQTLPRGGGCINSFPSDWVGKVPSLSRRSSYGRALSGR